MEYTLVLTDTQLSVIDKALQSLTLGEAFSVYIEIKNQVTSQIVKNTTLKDINEISAG